MAKIERQIGSDRRYLKEKTDCVKEREKRDKVIVKRHGKWLWPSWQSGRLQFQRTRVQIQSSATFIEHFLLLTVCRKDENKKEAGNGPFLKIVKRH